MESYIVKNITYYRNVIVNGNDKISKETINFYELTFILSGSLTYFVNGTKYILNENDAILIKPHMTRERPAGKQKVNYISFNFHVYDDKQLPEGIFLKKAISQELRNMITVFPMKHLVSSYRGKEKATNLLNYILHEIHNTVELKSSNQYIIKIEKYINAHINDSISLNDVSKHINLSKEYTASIFKKETNMTVIEYINEKKLLLAKEMMQTSSMSLNSISESLGYENYSYFSKIFKEKFGLSPKKLVKQQ